MKLSISLHMAMILYNKTNMEPLKVEKAVKKEWEENSEEYKALCSHYRDVIGYDRGNTCQQKDKYDKKVLKMAADDAKRNMLDTVNMIEDIIRQCYTKKIGAYIEYAGYIINPADFCAIKVLEPVLEFKKE